MPYLAFELDAKKKVPLVARAADSTAPAVAWALLELWEHVWASKRDVLSIIEVRGCIGTAPTLLDALVAFGFLEPVENGFRVRGADRYLRLAEARRKGAEATNKKRSERSVSHAQATQESAGATLERRSDDALSPKVEQRAPNVEDRGEEAQPSPLAEKSPVVIAPPDKPVEQWQGEDFWRWFQHKRQEAGFVAERGPPPRLSFWWSPVMLELNGNVERLKEGVYRFGEDPFWQKNQLPWRGFQTQWPSYVPREVPRAEA